MSFATIFTSIVLTQAAPIAYVRPAPESDEVVYVDVAYGEIAQGRNQAAVARILADRTLADDPAALINLGTASARMGDFDKAQTYFRAAMASENRTNLQLADGRWMDSRRAARIALDSLSQRSLAAR